MRIGVFALALIAFAQPAFAKQNSHRHPHQTARTHHLHHAAHHRSVHAARVRRAPIESGYAMPRTFARTDATDTPFFSDPSFPNKSWAQNSRNQVWSPNPEQQFSAFEPAPRVRNAPARDGALDGMIARHAAANGLPVGLVHRVVIRESRYNPRARNGGNLGLMQIKHATARGVGYSGSAAGLLDPETNLTYAVRYLAGAYRAAGGNANRAVSYYASGYHRRGTRQPPLPQQAVAWSAPSEPAWGMRWTQVAMRDNGILMRDDNLRLTRY